jgi:hypothetical protein
MFRQFFCAVLLASAALGLSHDAEARTTCESTYTGQVCVSEVDVARFAQQAFQTQQASQWCWAASIAMIFAYHDHPVAQARIVSEVYGRPVDMPAQAGVVMAQQLNREWLDESGAAFTARLTGVYDAYAGVYGLTNAQIVAELDRGNPLLLANRTHAVVLTSVRYQRTAAGPEILGAMVFDPWPGIGARPLRQAELMGAHTGYGELTFVAMASVTGTSTPPVRPTPPGVTPPPGPTPPPSLTPPPVDAADGGGGSFDLLAVLLLTGLAFARRRRA